MTATDKRTYGRVELLCDVLAGVCLLVMFLLVALYWNQLPEQIPTHYGFDGQPDAWGGRGGALFMPLLGLLTFALLTGARFLPASMFNFPVAVTDENRERLLQLGRELLSVVKCCILVSLLPGTVYQVGGQAMPPWFPAVMMLLISAPVVIYIVRMVKNK